MKFYVYLFRTRREYLKHVAKVGPKGEGTGNCPWRGEVIARDLIQAEAQALVAMHAALPANKFIYELGYTQQFPNHGISRP